MPSKYWCMNSVGLSRSFGLRVCIHETGCSDHREIQIDYPAIYLINHPSPITMASNVSKPLNGARPIILDNVWILNEIKYRLTDQSAKRNDEGVAQRVLVLREVSAHRFLETPAD